ncbi:MAG TPA: riboflavin synthase [Verrucomicrobiae bacterium]|jgi:riboflavin synthase|nr:riboflavin synthase [Verrucomicrobiae bacterium]
MFSGIVEETGEVVSVTPSAQAIGLVVRAKICARGVTPGDSVAVNGCCLTVEKLARRGAGGLLYFSLLQESWRLTNLQSARPGAAVNLERALRVGDKLGGHFVTGHIDGMGKILRWEREGRDPVLEIGAAPAIMRYIVKKGSIALDGISLTVAEAGAKRFRVWIIPHTFDVTALRERRVGDAVNLEADMLGKYVERFVTG